MSWPSSSGSPSSAVMTISSKRPGSTSITSSLSNAALPRKSALGQCHQLGRRTRPVCGRSGRLSPGAAVRSSQRSGTSSAGWPPGQLLDSTALALGRTPRAAVARSHRDSLLAWWKGRTVVDVALGGSRCAGTFGDDPQDDHDAFASLLAQPHLITGPDRMRGLDPRPVDPDVPGPAGTGRGRAGPGQPHRPDPAVHSPARLITCHSATLMRCAPFHRALDSAGHEYRHAERLPGLAPATRSEQPPPCNERAHSLHGLPQVARARIGGPEGPSVREAAGTSTSPLPYQPSSRPSRPEGSAAKPPGDIGISANT